MTDFTLSSASICKPYRSPWGAFPTRTFPISTGISSAAIQIGRIMTMDGGDAVDQSSVADCVIPSTGTAAVPLFYIAGIAAQAVSGSTSTYRNEVTVWEANPMVEFSAVTKGATLQSSVVGMTKKITHDSTLNIAYVQLAASTAAEHRVVITQLLDAAGDSGGRVAFRFLPSISGTIQGTTATYNSSTPILAFYR